MPATGYGMIAGRGRETALAALAAAEAVGVPASEVRTEADGYLVPLLVLDAYEATLKRVSDIAEAAKTVPDIAEAVKTPVAAPVKKAPVSKKKSDPSGESPSDSNAKH